MRPMARWLFHATRSILIAVLIAIASPAFAGAEFRVNKDSENVAILGYDPVAYFTVGHPVEGKIEFSDTWQDAEWRFSSAKHRDMFADNPERYTPRYGGFCAGGMALGYVLRIDPNAWIIIDDKLYLNYDKAYKTEFVANAEREIKRADSNWKVLGKVN